MNVYNMQWVQKQTVSDIIKQKNSIIKIGVE